MGDCPRLLAERAPAGAGVLAPVSAFRLVRVTIWRTCPSTTTPITTIVAAPATARAGRSHGKAGRNGARVAWRENPRWYPAWRRHLRRIAHVNAGSSQIVISRARSAQSVTSSVTFRTADGVVSRRMIRVSPSSAGSMASATACRALRRTSSRSRRASAPRVGSGRSWPSRALTGPPPQPPEGLRWRSPGGASPQLRSPPWPRRPGLPADRRSTSAPALPAARPTTIATP
jgi:hypothetical protein